MIIPENNNTSHVEEAGKEINGSQLEVIFDFEFI
jgi:hypothetical protein